MKMRSISSREAVGVRRLIVATDESPESLANRPLLSLPLSLLVVKRFCVGRRWRRLWLLGLGSEIGEGRPCILAREMEDALPAGHFGVEAYSFARFHARWFVCGCGRGKGSIGGIEGTGVGRGGKYGNGMGIDRSGHGGGRGRDGCVVAFGSG